MKTKQQEGWVERFEKRFSPIWLDLKAYKRNIKQFIRQELTTLHKADCERFRGIDEMLGKRIFDLECLCEKDNPKCSGNCKYQPVIDELMELRTALSKMEEEL